MSPGIETYLSRRQLIDTRAFYFGEIYVIKDELISLPRADRVAGGRNLHEERGVVIVSNNPENCDPLCPVVMVAPLSHRTDLKRPFDLELFSHSDNVLYDCLVMLQAQQPVLKVDLGECKGSISEGKKEELMALICEFYGIPLDL